MVLAHYFHGIAITFNVVFGQDDKAGGSSSIVGPPGPPGPPGAPGAVGQQGTAVS